MISASARTATAVRHLLFALATLLIVSFVIFVTINISRAPTDVARHALGRSATDAALAEYVREHHLDDPLVARYAIWVGHFAAGDWGTSTVTQREVRPAIAPRLQRTFLLAALSMLVALPISLWLGVALARRYGSSLDVGANLGLVSLSAMPEFVVGIAVLAVFAIWLDLLPPNSAALSYGRPGERAEAFALPIVTLALVSIPYLTRVTRVAAREALLSGYARAATLRGVSRRSVTWNHAMRNAAVPIANAVALNFIYLLGGVIVVENLFGFPGAGQAMVEAIGSGDAITVEAIGVVMAIAFIGISIVADLVVVYFNPRLRTAHR